MLTVVLGFDCVVTIVLVLGLLVIDLVFVVIWFVWLVSACGCLFVGYLHLALFAALVCCSFFGLGCGY